MTVKPKEPEDTIGSVAIAVLWVASLAGGVVAAAEVAPMFGKQVALAVAVGMIITATAVIAALAVFTWPYVTPFVAVPAQVCWRCRYDLRGSGRICPECGAARSGARVREAIAARVQAPSTYIAAASL